MNILLLQELTALMNSGEQMMIFTWGICVLKIGKWCRPSLVSVLTHLPEVSVLLQGRGKDPPCFLAWMPMTGVSLWDASDIPQDAYDWSNWFVWELLRVRRVLQEHRCVSALRRKRTWKLKRSEESVVDTFQPWMLKKGLGREGNKKSSVSQSEESSNILQQPEISFTVFVVLSSGVIGVLCKGLLSCSPRQKADSRPVTHILSFTALVVLCHLDIYSVTHCWESRGLPLYSKHCAMIIMRKWDKWQAFLPTRCHNLTTSYDTSWLGHCAVCSVDFTWLVVLAAVVKLRRRVVLGAVQSVNAP